MKKVTFAIMGMGNRGTQYASKQLKYPDEMEIVAMADNRRVRLDAANKYLNIPQERLFSSGEEMLKAPKLADIMIIATQDKQHKDHAIAAMEKGYDLLLEKPIANTAEDVYDIVEAANRLGRRVIICHVLRYTHFYQQIKKLLDSGVIGKVESVEANECVGYYHIAHSYVRGNWHKEADSSPMILAKCCHDMDLILWLTGKKCLKLNSFGSLDYFKAENCPEGAAERCTDGCKVKDCPFNAPKFYLGRMPGWPTNILHPEPTEENIMEILRTANYGKCVFKMDNDVVDHQTVNMLLEDGVTVTFQMNGFNNKQDRYIRIMGTEGEIWGNLRGNKVYYQRFNEKMKFIDIETLTNEFSGHGGGDSRLIYDVIRLLRGDDFDKSSITTIDRSAESHFVAFAAEASRVNGGTLINMDNFTRNIKE